MRKPVDLKAIKPKKKVVRKKKKKSTKIQSPKRKKQAGLTISKDPVSPELKVESVPDSEGLKQMQEDLNTPLGTEPPIIDIEDEITGSESNNVEDKSGQPLGVTPESSIIGNISIAGLGVLLSNKQMAPLSPVEQEMIKASGVALDNKYISNEMMAYSPEIDYITKLLMIFFSRMNLKARGDNDNKTVDTVDETVKPIGKNDKNIYRPNKPADGQPVRY